MATLIISCGGGMGHGAGGKGARGIFECLHILMEYPVCRRILSEILIKYVRSKTGSSR